MFHECRHIKTNGERCHAAALSGKPYCYFHMNLRRMHSPRLADQHFQLPPIEDNASILLALGQVLKTLNSPYADARRAGLMLYALQIAAQLTNRKEQSKPTQSVRNLYSPSEEELDFSSAVDNGIDMLAPDNEVCEPPEDCRNCPRQRTCPNYEEPEDNAEDNHENQQPDNSDDDEDEELDEENLNRLCLHASAAVRKRSPSAETRPPLKSLTRWLEREAVPDSPTAAPRSGS